MPGCIFLTTTVLVFIDIVKRHLFIPEASLLRLRTASSQPFFTRQMPQFPIISVALCWILCRMSMSLLQWGAQNWIQHSKVWPHKSWVGVTDHLVIPEVPRHFPDRGVFRKIPSSVWGTGTPCVVVVIMALLELPPEQCSGKAMEGDTGMEWRQAFLSSRSFFIGQELWRRDPEVSGERDFIGAERVYNLDQWGKGLRKRPIRGRIQN